jgi:hypothetical protein
MDPFAASVSLVGPAESGSGSTGLTFGTSTVQIVRYTEDLLKSYPVPLISGLRLRVRLQRSFSSAMGCVLDMPPFQILQCARDLPEGHPALLILALRLHNLLHSSVPPEASRCVDVLSV